MNSTADQRFHRTQLLLGEDIMARLRSVRIALFGVGGVGSWCGEALVRSGVSHLTLVDPDLVCATNVNRQLQATPRTLGSPKVEALRARLLEVNPEADIVALRLLYDQSTCGQCDLGQYDYVLDAVDTLKNKVLLLRCSLEAGVTVFCSMGAAGKLDPTRIRTAPIGRTRHCPLARMVRKRLRQQGVTGDFLCVYSEEFPSENRGQTFCGNTACACPEQDDGNLCLAKARINGSLAPVTGAFGLALAGLVIQDVAQAHGLKPQLAAASAGSPHAPAVS
jgi:tRNA A37 threonylcarbamoyladenosine dehydratase